MWPRSWRRISPVRLSQIVIRADVVGRGKGLAIGAEGEVPDEPVDPGGTPEELAGFEVEGDSEGRWRPCRGEVAAVGSRHATTCPASQRPSGLKATSWNRLVGSS